MRILLINQFFWPDSAATSQLLTDAARGLAGLGHSVHAICAEGNYAPQGSDLAPPVEIHRAKTLPFVRGKLGRLLSYASFYLSAIFRGLTLPRPDVVITLTTPPLLSVLGTALKYLRNSRHFSWEMDVYPDVAVDLGYFSRGGLADRLSGLLADFSRRHSDGILALGECMRDRLIQRGIPASKISIAENWADSSAIVPLPTPAAPGRLTVLYSGNLGLAHDLDTIAQAILALKDDPRFHFVFAGSGVRRAEFEQFCSQHSIPAVEFQTYVDRPGLSGRLNQGDIGLVTQCDACCGSVVPSKVYGLMAAGRPILFIGPADATPARIVRRFGCGWHINCGDASSTLQLLQRLVSSPDEVRAAGERARNALLLHYDLPLGVSRVCSLVGASSSVDCPSPLALSLPDL